MCLHAITVVKPHKQNGKQYNTQNDHDADYDEIPYEIVKGGTCSGVVVFPAMSTDDFYLTIDMHSDDSNERIDTFEFVLGEETADLLDYGYRAAVQTIIDYYNGELTEIENIFPQELWKCMSNYLGMPIPQMQRLFEENTETSNRRTAFVIISEERLTQVQLADYLAGLSHRYSELNIQYLQDGYRLIVEIQRINGTKEVESPVIIKIGGNWYWTYPEWLGGPAFCTGPFTPAA